MDLTIAQLPRTSMKIEEIVTAIVNGECVVRDVSERRIVRPKVSAADIERLRAFLILSEKSARADAMLQLRMDGRRYRDIAAAYGISANRARIIVTKLAAKRGITLGWFGGVREIEMEEAHQ